MTLSETEMKTRRDQVSNALASQRLEGVEPDQETVADLERFTLGELEIGDVLGRLKGRLQGEQVR